MKKIILLFIVIASTSFTLKAQEIIKGITNNVWLVKKSSKVPQLKMKDGEAVALRYDVSDGIHLSMNRNGKASDFCEPFGSASLVQIAESDVDGDGKMEFIVADRSAPDQFTISIYKRPDFEYDYELWGSFDGQNYVEFPGNGLVKLYDMDMKATNFKFSYDGKLKVAE